MWISPRVTPTTWAVLKTNGSVENERPSGYWKPTPSCLSSNNIRERRTRGQTIVLDLKWPSFELQGTATITVFAHNPVTKTD